MMNGYFQKGSFCGVETTTRLQWGRHAVSQFLVFFFLLSNQLRTQLTLNRR